MAKRRYEGCIEAREISLCPVSLGGGANPHAHVLMLKSMGGTSAEAKTEKTQMPLPTEAEKQAAAAQEAAIQKAAREISNKLLAMNDVTKAHYLALDDAGQVAFLQKSAEDQAKEAGTAKAAADQKRQEEEAAKSGVTPQVLELQKSNETLRAEVETLKAAQVERDLEKRADAEFAGYPGGSAAVVPLLKAYAGLPEAVRVASENALKAQCKVAKTSMLAFAGRTEADLSKAAGARAKVHEAAKAYASENKVTFEVALEKVSERPDLAEDVELMNEMPAG